MATIFCANVLPATRRRVSPDSAPVRFRGLKSEGWTRRVVLRAAVFAALTVPLPAASSPAASDPRAFVEGLGAETLDIIKSPDVKIAERQRRFSVLFARAFDAPAIGRFVIGPYWNKVSEDERARYLETFGNYVAAIYAIQFSHYNGESFRTVSIDPVGNGDSAVPSEIVRPGKTPLRIAFRVRGTPGAFKIVDVNVEGVSLIVTKREEFASVLGKEGLDGVVKRMQAVLSETQARGGAGWKQG